MKYLVLAVVLLTMACVDSHTEVNKINYFRDNHTGLCFAAYRLQSPNGLLTNVPCTPEVERLIKGGGQ